MFDYDCTQYSTDLVGPGIVGGCVLVGPAVNHDRIALVGYEMPDIGSNVVREDFVYQRCLEYFGLHPGFVDFRLSLEVRRHSSRERESCSFKFIAEAIVDLEEFEFLQTLVWNYSMRSGSESSHGFEDGDVHQGAGSDFLCFNPHLSSLCALGWTC